MSSWNQQQNYGYNPNAPGGYNPRAPPQTGAGYNHPYQNTGYQQQTGAPPPQNRGYSPHVGGYPPQTGGFPAQTGGYHPQQQAAPQAPPAGIDPVLWGWFQSVDRDRSGGISAEELKLALLNNNWSHFNSETCRLMIGMFDKDRSGSIDIYEFAALWKYIQEWKNCFERFDTDRSGTIDCNELLQAFSSFGYRLSMEFCRLCVRVFDRTSVNSMKFDDFIQCCVMLKSLTDAFKRYDTQQRGIVHINYEQFLEMVLDNQLSGLK